MTVSAKGTGSATGVVKITFANGKPEVIKDKNGNDLKNKEGKYILGYARMNGAPIGTITWDGVRVYKVG